MSNAKKGLLKNKFFIAVGRVVLKIPVLGFCKAKVESYKPKHDTFIVIANHTDFMDPGYQMFSIKKYIRFVCADHVIRDVKILDFILKKISGVIIKYKNLPSSVLTNEIKENLKAGISVAIHAEGGTTGNGETGFVSEHTGQLVKESGVALITYRITGGYLRNPRWCDKQRTGKIYGKVVQEYSPEYLAQLSAEEITDIIRKDIRVNAYEEQKLNPQVYKGERLAEHVERILYICPKCSKVGNLHSNDDMLECTCGYKVRYGEDGFFHDTGTGLVFDNIYDWDMWQRDAWQNIMRNAEYEIFREGGQILYKVENDEKVLKSENAEIVLNTDSIEIITENDAIKIHLSNITKMQQAFGDNLAILDADNYYFVKTKIPRSAEKYIVAWRFLTNKVYV